MEADNVMSNIEDLEELETYLKQLYGELRKTPVEDMQQRVDELTDPLSRIFYELVTSFTINELKQVRDKATNIAVRRKTDELIFFMERRITEGYMKKAIDAEIMNVRKSKKWNKGIIGEGLSTIGYANPYLGKIIEEEIVMIYGYVFDEDEIKIKVDLREKEMKISPDANETDIIHGCSRILEFAIREYEPDLWGEYKRIKLNEIGGGVRKNQKLGEGVKPPPAVWAVWEFESKLLDKGILTDSLASETFANDFGLYALSKSGKGKGDYLNKDLQDFFDRKISNFEVPSTEDIILVY